MKNTYKIILAFSLLGFLVVFSCRKKELVEEAENYTSYAPAHCFNGYHDANEIWNDCGGACPLCDEVVSHCIDEIPVNKLIVKMTNSGNIVENDTLTISNILKNQNGSEITYSASTSNNMNIEIKVTDTYFVYNNDTTSTNYMFRHLLVDPPISNSSNDAALSISGGNYGWSTQYFTDDYNNITLMDDAILYWNSYNDGQGNIGESLVVCNAHKAWVGTPFHGTCTIDIQLHLVNY